MRIQESLGVILAMTLLSGCSSMDVLTKKQMETEGRLEQILQANAAQRTQLADLSKELQGLSQKVADHEAFFASQRAEIEAVKSQLAAKQKIAPNTEAAATIEVVSAEPAKTDTESQQQEAYMKAFGIFSANRYSEAISAFTAFIAAYPNSEYAANAQYWIGECHYSQKEYQKALAAFNAVLTNYPKGKKAPDAMLKVAFSQLSLNDTAAAKGTMRQLIETYPKSPAAAKAKERLNRP
jgi:tol-pal system protein YbgF